MKVVELKGDIKSSLEVLEDLRSRVDSGDVVAFAIVGVRASDDIRAWLGNTKHISQLKIIGATHKLLEYVSSDECRDD